MTNSETKNFSQNVSSSYHLEDRNKNVPKLRFKGYNDEWKHYRLKDITTRITRKNNKLESDRPLTISAIDGLIDQKDYFNRQIASKDMSGYYLLKNGEFAYNKSYSNGFPYGSIKRLNKYDKGALSTLYICFSLQNICSDFLEKYFETDKWYKEIYMIAVEGARNHGLLNISVEDFFNTIHKFPNIEEQEKIASFLTLIDKKIEKQKELVELLKKYKRGLLSAIFSQKLRFKDDNGNDYPAWEEKRLGDICKIVGGGTPDTNNVKYWGDDINWFTPTEIIKKYADSSNRKISRLGLLKSSAKILPIGTVLLTTRATLGEMSILSIEATTNQGFQSLIPVKDEVSSEFIYYCQPIIKHFCYKYANGSTFLEISKQTLAKLKLMIPNKDEQNKISDFLSKFDDKIQQEECILSNLQTYKKGLLQQMFI